MSNAQPVMSATQSWSTPVGTMCRAGFGTSRLSWRLNRNFRLFERRPCEADGIC